MSTTKSNIGATAPYSAARTCDDKSCARDRIFEAARFLFYRFGIRAVSVEQIATEASTTKVTLYRLFDSKDDLIVQVLEDHKRRFWDWWESTIAPFEGQPREQLTAIFDSLCEQVCAGGAERGCPVVNTAVEIVDDEHPAKRIIREHNAEIAQRLRELCRTMDVPDPDALGDALTLLMIGAFGSRIVFDNAQQVAAVKSAARALIESAVRSR